MKKVILAVGLMIGISIFAENIYFGPGQQIATFEEAFECAQTGDYLIELTAKTYTFPSQWTIPDYGWKWLSFDILWPEEDDNIAEYFLAPISDIDELDFALFKPHSPGSQPLTISFYPTQQNLDHPFTSPYGYKFKTITDCQFTVTGQRCPAETTFPLFSNNQENWIGYFLEETQLVYDAFGTHLDELTQIKAQHWTINKVNGVWPPDIAAYTISPGDMVIVYCERDIPAFSWSFEESREKYVMPESQDFTYEEEADYIPVFIALDPNDLPSEIGAYVEGECKGATVVQDTTAQICAYILENQGEDLEFEFSYGSKEQNKQFKEYGICEPETSKTVKGTIQIDNSRDCYYVSFKNGQNITPVPTQIEITNFPNPFNPETTLFFSLPNEQKIELSVYNLKGQKVRQLVKGQFPSGNNSIVWNGKDDSGKQVCSGVYLYKLETADKIISKKMLLLK
ncbi:MAG: T9SS type A sorting domain-containing protein [Candidatus Cloacimonadales bacterium]|nr:T9SS type A sorting domain-containing protein [Candidatus Cloacimonadales bacterium]